MFVFGDFNIHQKDCLTYFGGIDKSGELFYNFSISNDLTQMLNFLTQIPDCDSHTLPLLDLFISSDASIYSTMAFPTLVNSDHVVVSVSIDFLSNSKHALCHHMTYHGPTLFLIYINDLPDDVICNIATCANDTIL